MTHEAGPEEDLVKKSTVPAVSQDAGSMIQIIFDRQKALLAMLDPEYLNDLKHEVFISLFPTSAEILNHLETLDPRQRIPFLNSNAKSVVGTVKALPPESLLALCQRLIPDSNIVTMEVVKKSFLMAKEALMENKPKGIAEAQGVIMNLFHELPLNTDKVVTGVLIGAPSIFVGVISQLLERHSNDITVTQIVLKALDNFCTRHYSELHGTFSKSSEDVMATLVNIHQTLSSQIVQENLSTLELQYLSNFDDCMCMHCRTMDIKKYSESAAHTHYLQPILNKKS